MSRRNPPYSDATQGVGTGQGNANRYESVNTEPRADGKPRIGRGATVSRTPETSLGSILRRLRKEMGVSQKAIADRLGINVSQISRKETGSEYFPRLPNLVAHLDILGARLAIELPDGTIIPLPNRDFINADGSPRQ